MSWLDFIFGTSKIKKISYNKQSKLSRQDIVDLVGGIQSLDYKQKQLVKDELIKEIDDGGVSRWEYKRIIEQLANKRVSLGLSEIDIKNLKKVI